MRGAELSAGSRWDCKAVGGEGTVLTKAEEPI